MNRTDLIKDVARRMGSTQKEAENTVTEVLGAIKNGVEANGEVKLLGFGSFKSTLRKERIGRNPATGNAITIPEKNVVKFKPYF